MLKRLIILLGCIGIVLSLMGCKREGSDPVPAYDLGRNGRYYLRVGTTSISNVDTLLGEVKKLTGEIEPNGDYWYSTKFSDGDKVYKYKGKDINEIVIVEANGYCFEMKALKE